MEPIKIKTPKIELREVVRDQASGNVNVNFVYKYIEITNRTNETKIE